MALLGSLQVRLGLDASTFQTGFNVFQRDLQKRVTGFQRSLRGLTDLGSLIGGAGLTAGLTNAITASGNFQQSLSQVQAASGATGIQIQALSDLALQMGKSTVFGANEAAAAMLDLAKAGLTPAQISGGALVSTMQLAATEGIELSRAANIMAEQMGAFGLSAADTAAIADALAGASVASTASVDGLAQGLSQVAAVANLSGLSLQETSATLALLSQNGIKGSDAGTSLKTMLLRLIPTTKDAESEMKRLGITFTTSEGKIKDITQISQILQDKLGTLTEAQRTSTLQTIFGTDAFRAAAILTKAGSQQLQTYITATNDKQAAEKLSEARTKGLNGSLAMLRNSFENLGISLMQGGFLDGLASLATKAADILGRASELPNWVKNTALGITAAGAAAPFLAFGLTSIAGVIPILTKGIGLAATFLLGPWGLALTGAALAGWVFKDEILGAFSGITAGLATFSAENKIYLDSLKDEAAVAGRTISADLNTIETFFANLRNSGNQAGAQSSTDSRLFADSWGEAFAGIVTAGEFAIEGIMWVWEELKIGGHEFWRILDETWQKIQPALAPVVEELQIMFLGLQTHMESLGKMFTGTAEKIKSAWSSVSTTIQSVGESIGLIDAKSHTPLSRLSGKINGAAAALQNFGKVGEKETDRAVGNSWLTDLTDQGQRHFQALIQNGITPATAALTAFGKNGDALTPTFTPGITGGDPTAPFQGLSIDPAQDFESAWSISLRNTQQALDQFVHTGELSVKGLVRTMIAEFASAQLRKALGSIWDSFKGGSGGSGIFSSTSGGGGSIWGSVAGLAGTLFKSFGSFEGGGYTGDSSRTGGLDGRGGRLAILHPKETVIDHTKIKSSAPRQKSVNLTVPITLMPGVSREELAQILPQVQQNMIQIIPELLNRGGAYASAYGR